MPKTITNRIAASHSETVGTSPKVIYSGTVAVLLYALSLVTDVDPQLEQAVNIIGTMIAAVVAGPGEVQAKTLRGADAG